MGSSLPQGLPVRADSVTHAPTSEIQLQTNTDVELVAATVKGVDRALTICRRNLPSPAQYIFARQGSRPQHPSPRLHLGTLLQTPPDPDAQERCLQTVMTS